MTSSMDAPAAGRRSDANGLARAARTTALGASVLVPACLAASQIGNVADAAHDAGLARVVGLHAEPWRALDVVVGSLFAAAPLGTPSARAAAGGALVLGVAGATLYLLTRHLLGVCTTAPRGGPLVAAIATLSALLAPMWQIEGAAPGGAATGAVLILAPIALLALRQHGGGSEPRGRGQEEGRAPPKAAVIDSWGAPVAILGLALGYEPLVGAASLGTSAAFLLASPRLRRSLAAAFSAPFRPAAPGHESANAAWMATAACAIAALAPLLVAMARTRASDTALDSLLVDAWAGERGASLAGSPVALLRGELGWFGGALALGGFALAMFVPEARALTSALAGVVILGLLSGSAEPLGPTRFGAPVLAAAAAAWALAAVAMQGIVRAVAKARLPFSRASAALVLVLECVIPVEAADEAILRVLPRADGAAATWDDFVWGLLPAHTAVLVTDRRLYARALAARAAGSLRADLVLLPTRAANAPGAMPLGRETHASDEALVPLFRDLALTGKPSEGSLASLAAARPLAMAYEPHWGRALVRHLVPLSLLDRFEPEPRAASDRRRALERFRATREQLARACAGHPELAGAAAYLLRARALALATNGDHDRDVLAHAAEDINRFAPGDSLAAVVAGRADVGLPRGVPPANRGPSGADTGEPIDDLQP